MKNVGRIVVLIFLATVFCGCRAQNNMGINPLAGLGSPRISPPGTGSYQASAAGAETGTYYNSTIPGGSTLPPAAAPTNPGQASLSPGWNPSYPVPPTALNYSFPAPAQYQQPLTIPANNLVQATNTSAIRAENYVSGPAAQVAELPQYGGMPVNDATDVRAPSRFVPQGNWNQMNQTNQMNQIPYVPPTSGPTQTWEYVVSPTTQVQGPTPAYGYGPGGYAYAPPMVYGNQVLAQSSTATGDRYSDAGYSSGGWRQRDSSGYSSQPTYHR